MQSITLVETSEEVLISSAWVYLSSPENATADAKWYKYFFKLQGRCKISY